VGHDKGIAIGQENCFLPFAIPGGKGKILFHLSPLFDPKLFVAVRTTKGAAVMGTSDRNLEDN